MVLDDRESCDGRDSGGRIGDRGEQMGGDGGGGGAAAVVRGRRCRVAVAAVMVGCCMRCLRFANLWVVGSD